jgi:hypothetical protein
VTVLEQRKSRRFELKLPLELLRSGSRRLLESGETKNLSSVGVLFDSAAQLEPGDVVEYMITLPSFANGAEVRLRCKGKIVRRTTDSSAAATLDRWEFVRERKPAVTA